VAINIKQVSMEEGGKSAFIVSDDEDSSKLRRRQLQEAWATLDKYAVPTPAFSCKKGYK